MFWGGLALVLILISVFTPWLTPARSVLGSAAVPFYWVVDLPDRFAGWWDEAFVSRAALQKENEALHQELLILKREQQKLAALAVDNANLRQLMNSAELVEDRVLIAELIGVSPDPLTHTVMVNKGSNSGVYVGQPLLDAYGLMGQVIEVTPFSSQVLLITDSAHALPVEVNRNGVRAVVEGIGDLYALRIPHVPNTADIVEGDLLVSSGLGQRFPRGYPVADVVRVIRNPGQPFATVEARPRAQLNRSRHVLLVFSSKPGFNNPAMSNSTTSAQDKASVQVEAVDE